jgi:hypothetical protein
MRCLAQIFRKSRRAGIPGNFESVATGDQKTDGKNDPPIERSCLTKNFCNTKILGAYTVRYLFVIYGFSVAETENLRDAFLLGRALEFDHLEPF